MTPSRNVRPPTKSHASLRAILTTRAFPMSAVGEATVKSDTPLVYRVSWTFLRNLWQQAIFGAIGVISCWIVFFIISGVFVPIGWQPGDHWYWIPSHAGGDFERELFRFLVGPTLAILVLFGGALDFQTWVVVRYEVCRDKLVMHWRSWSRSIPWDVMKTVEERPHAVCDLHSLSIIAAETRPILVRGLEQMPEFIEIVRRRTSKLTQWTVANTRIDLTRRLTNFIIGFLVPLPIFGTWLLYFVAGWHETTLIRLWSFGMFASAIHVWYTKPLSSRHSSSRELELLLAILTMIASSLLTLISWVETPAFIELMNRLF
jgi:hypothetical protein